jgi:hypothetical protein
VIGGRVDKVLAADEALPVVCHLESVPGVLAADKVLPVDCHRGSVPKLYAGADR